MMQAVIAAYDKKLGYLSTSAAGMIECLGKTVMANLVSHIAKTPGVCGGRACIAGHRIRVLDIVVWHEKRGHSPDEIVDQFPGITLADVYAALAYYFDNREEIEADLRGDEQMGEWLKTTIPSKIPAEFREKHGA